MCAAAKDDDGNTGETGRKPEPDLLTAVGGGVASLLYILYGYVIKYQRGKERKQWGILVLNLRPAWLRTSWDFMNMTRYLRTSTVLLNTVLQHGELIRV